MTPLTGRDMPHVSWYALRRRILRNRILIRQLQAAHHHRYHPGLCCCPRRVRG